MPTTRHVMPNALSGWQITDAEGQHTAHIDGSRQDALDCAYRQLDTGGHVTVDDHDA